MFKNFCPAALGINGRQSELIELALTYAFRGMDVDMYDMLRRSQRSSFEESAKYLKAAEIRIGAFDVPVNLDADDEAFTASLATLHPLSEIAEKMGAKRAIVRLPPATDRLPFQEFFEVQRTRLSQIAEVLAAREIQLAIGFRAGKELADGKQFAFVRTVETFRALVNAVPNKNAGYFIDTWDWVVGEGTLELLKEIPVERIVCVRLASVPDDVTPATAKSTDRVLPVLDSPLKLAKVIAHLEAIKFKGPVSPSASSSRYKGQTREFIVQKAHEAIDAIFKEAGLTVSPLPADLIEDIPYEPSPMMM